MTDFVVISRPNLTAAPDRIDGMILNKKADEGEQAIRETAVEPGRVYVALPLSRGTELEARPGGLEFGEPVEPEAEAPEQIPQDG